MQKIEVLEIKYNSNEYWQLVRNREIILRIPLFMRFSKEQLQLESNEQIFGIKVDNFCVGSCQYQFFPDLQIGKMRQVAILKKYQGKGLGKELIITSELYCKTNGIKKIQCHARTSAIPFYESLGYHCVSEEFEEVGLPHKKMEKIL